MSYLPTTYFANVADAIKIADANLKDSDWDYVVDVTARGFVVGVYDEDGFKLGNL